MRGFGFSDTTTSVQGEKGRASAARGRWGVPLAAALGGRVVPKAGWGAWARRGASALATLLVLGLSAQGAFAYDYLKSITIDRSKIDIGTYGATLANYPMLFSVTDPDLRVTGSGGRVTDSQGDDIIFRGLDATTCGAAPPVLSITRSRSTSRARASSSPM